MCSQEDTKDMNRKRAEIYLRLLSEAELRRARMLPRPGFGARKIAPGSQWWRRRPAATGAALVVAAALIAGG